jgi:hypothetical protein
LLARIYLPAAVTLYSVKREKNAKSFTFLFFFYNSQNKTMESTKEEERQRKLANILETYFSDASLLWDKVMLSKIVADPNGSK